MKKPSKEFYAACERVGREIKAFSRLAERTTFNVRSWQDAQQLADELNAPAEMYLDMLSKRLRRIFEEAAAQQ